MTKSLALKRAGLFCLVISLVFLFVPSVFAAGNKELKIGVAAGPDAQIAECVKGQLAKKGITLKIIEFNDYVQPNLALDSGELDANAFQHVQYFNEFTKQHKLNLSILANTYVSPIGLYSSKIKNIKELKNGAVIAIPNDPTNGGRALALLEKYKLITLKPGVGQTATALDIKSNPKKFVIKELDAAQTPRVLPDVDAAVINTNYALPAGLNPAKDSIVREDKDSPYVNIVAVRTKEKNNPLFKELAAAYNSKQTEKFIIDTFKNAMLPAF